MAVSLVSTGVQFPDNSIQTTAAAASGTTTATASGSISAGFPVVVNSNGTFSAVSGLGQTVGTPVNAPSSGSGKYSADAATDPVTGVTVIVSGNGSPMYAWAMTTTSNGTITIGSAAAPSGSTSDNAQIPTVVALGSNKFLIAYWVFPSNTGYLVVGTVSGTTLTFGTPVNSGSGAQQVLMAYNSTTGTVFMNYAGTGRVVSISGTTPSLGTAAAIGSGTLCSVGYDVTANKMLVCWQGTPTGGLILYAAVITMSGTTFSVGTTAQLDVSQPSSITGGTIFYSAYNVAAGVHVITYNGYSSGLGGYQMALTSGTISGTTFTFNPRILNSLFYNTGYDRCIAPVYCSDGNAMFIIGPSTTSSYLGVTQVFVTAGVNTLGTQIIIDSTYAQAPGGNGIRGQNGWDTVAKKYVRQFFYTNGAGYIGAIAFNPPFTNANTNNFLGLSSAAYTNGQTATVTIVSGTNTGVSGLTPGLKYYLNYDGTLSNTPNNPANLYAGLATGAAKIIVKG